MSSLSAVLFDVDFTLARPGPDLGPEGYRRLGERFGMTLRPERYNEARRGAVENLKHHPELRHDDEVWVEFTIQICLGMGGDVQHARALAVEMTQAWDLAHNFDLFEDALPVIAELRRYDLRIGLVSNTGRDLHEFVRHHALDVDAAISSRAHGWTKPHPTIFRAALERLGTRPGETVMVGDSVADDIEGARALGMRAFLVDRDGHYPEVADRLPDLYALPAALGLPRPG